MRRFQITSVLTALLLVLLTAAPSAFAQSPRTQQAYAQALQDLRYARSMLDFGTYHDVSPMTATAIDQINIAIKEIKEAQGNVGKGVDEHPPVDSSKKSHERFQEALAALNRAHTDIAGAEPNPKAKGLREEALHQIDAARIHTKQAYDRTVAEDPKH